ncbi:MAG: MFS transporter [Desulfovermiculus sp.]|nr:MFS transporter [Desulfovermiculus sp.]
MQIPDAVSQFLKSKTGTLFLLWGIGLYLRLTVLIAPPLTPLIGQDYGLSQAGMGALTTLPTLLLAVGAIPGSFITARFGSRNTLIAALLVVAFGSALRGFGGVIGLYAATLGMGLGIAAMQPALPALVQLWAPGRIGLATAVYTNGLLVGEILSSGLTLPVVLPLAQGSWRLCMALWSVPAFLVILSLVSRPGGEKRKTGQARLWLPNWRSKDVWVLGFVLGGISTLYFGTNAYTPNLLHARGQDHLITPALVSLNASQLASSALILLRPQWFVGKKQPLTIMTLCAVAGMLGVVLSISWGTVVWAGVVGIATSFVMILCLALPPVLADPERTASLAAGMFTIGYVCSFLVPLAGGAAWDITGSPYFAFVLFAIFSGTTAILPIWLTVSSSKGA